MFKNLVLSKYEVKAAIPPPTEDNMLPELTDFMAFCMSKGRGDLAKKIKEGWINWLNKMPESRGNWPLCQSYGRNSIAKNTFGQSRTKGTTMPQLFTQWLKDNMVELTEEDNKTLEAMTEKNPHNNQIPLATPAQNETLEKWEAAASNTADKVIVVRQAFAAAAQHIHHFYIRIKDSKRKIMEYGVGGPKHLTAKGVPHKFAERIPQWLKDIEITEQQISAIQEEERKFVQLMALYNKAPITTVAYEHAVLGSLNSVLEHVENVEDVKKKDEMLTQILNLLKKLGPPDGDGGAAAAGVEVTAGLGEKLVGMWTKFRGALAAMIKSIRGLKTSMDKLESLVTLA